MNTEKRLRALREMAERHDLEVKITHATQRDPDFIISPSSPDTFAPLIRVTSRDSLTVALGKMEAQLVTLTNLHRDMYFRHPHRKMGSVT